MGGTIRTPGLTALIDELVGAREAAGLTQRQLARKIGTTQTKVARFEVGSRRVDVVELVVLARALDLSPEDLIRLVADATPADQRL